MAALNDRSVSIGRIFSRAFGVMGSNPLVLFGVSLVLGALPQILLNAVLGFDQTNRLGLTQTERLAQGVFSMLLSIVLQSIVVGCVTRATVAFSQGRKASLGECLSLALSRVVPVIVVSILYGLGVAIGSVLLLVPGIIVAIMWVVVVQVTVEEDAGIFGAFGRSRFLTKGARWKIFGLILLLIVLGIVIGIVGALFSGLLIGISYTNPAVALTPGALIFNVIFSTIISALWSALQTSVFVELREWKDGPMEAKLGEIFE